MTYKDQLWQNPATPGSTEAWQYLRDHGLADQTIWDAELGYVGVPEPGDERFTHSIHIPYRDGRGGTRTPRFRHLRANSKRKFDQHHGVPANPYGIHLVKEPELWVTEGEIDALVLRQTGRPAIGIPGANSWQRSWKYLFRDCDLVVVVMDADDAGMRAGRKIAGQISTVTDVRTAELPFGMDISDLFVKDRATLEELL